MNTPAPQDTTRNNQRLSDLFDNVLQRHAGQSVEVGVLVNAFKERGFGVLLILFALPLAIPLPTPPPLDTILGIPLFYLCLQMMLGAVAPHVPKQVMKRKISVDFLIRAFTRGRKWLEKLERMFKPRLTRIGDKQIIRLCGALGLISCAAIVVPFPFSNSVPSVGLMIMGMGLVMHDRLAAIIGALVGVVWVLILLAAFAFGAGYLFDWFNEVF